MRIYIAGPYGDHLPAETRLANTMKAIEAGRKLILMGHNPFIPHLNHFIAEGWTDPLSSEGWYMLDLEWLGFCEGVLLLDGWGQSRGASIERSEAEYLGLRVYHSIEEIE